MAEKKRVSWTPSRRWCAAQVTAAAAFLGTWVNVGWWNKVLLLALIA